MNIKGRVERLERSLGGADERNRAPTEEEFMWAHRINRRHFELVEWREITREVNPQCGLSCDFPLHAEDEVAFLTECESGLLAKAHDILDRRTRAMGKTPWRDMGEAERDLERARLRHETEEMLGLLDQHQAQTEGRLEIQAF